MAPIDFGLVSSFLSILGAMIGAFIGSYLASFWTERRELMRKHHEEIKGKLLAPLKSNINTTISWAGDRATGLDFSEMIDKRYSPSYLPSLYQGVDRMLKEFSIKGHFPKVVAELEALQKDLEDYDSKYIDLATRVRYYLGDVAKDKVGLFTKVATYDLLEVPQYHLDNATRELSGGDAIALLHKLLDVVRGKMSDQDRLLIEEIIELSERTKNEGDALIDDLEDLLKRPTLESTCRYCPPSLRSHLKMLLN
jgi:hypothetical protein